VIDGGYTARSAFGDTAPMDGPARRTPVPAKRRSAGLLVFRRTGDGPQFLLVHPGGPFWRDRDEGAWSIPKGLVDPGEDELAAARREFLEETGLPAPEATAVRLAEIRQGGGKRVVCWLLEADLDLAGFRSNTFELEWPPRSGRTITVPECDAARYFDVDAALRKILSAQGALLREAMARLGAADAGSPL